MTKNKFNYTGQVRREVKKNMMVRRGSKKVARHFSTLKKHEAV